MNAHDLWEKLSLLDENERIEAKRAQEAGKSLLETICAFANEPGLGGGWLLLGVAPDEQALFAGYAVEGVPQPDKLSADLASQCATMFNVPLRVDIRTEALEGKPVVVVHVPESPAQDKPVYFKATGLPKGAFRRIGSTDQRCTEDDLETLYQSRQRDSFDAGLLADAELDDLDESAIAEYRQARAEANPDAEELRWSDLDVLRALNAVRRDGAGAWKPTVAGVLLFGKPVALRRSFPMTRVDYIRVPGREWVPHPERRFDTVELRGPLFSLLRRAQAAILDDLPKSFGLEEGQLQRTDQPVIPLRALREALVNALMHRSYRVHAPVQVIRYANRLEIRNPGFSLKSPDHLGEPGSMPRNPHIAAVLHVTKPTLSYYVLNKEQMLFECFREGLDRVARACGDARDTKLSGRTRLIEVVCRYVEAITSDFGWCMVRAEDQDLSPAMSARIKRLKSEIDQEMRSLIRQGIADGSIGPCDPKMAAFALAGALNWIAHWYRDDASLSAGGIAERFVELFVNGLAPRPSGVISGKSS